MEIITIYVTFPSKKSARRISKSLLKDKLIACANIHEGSSMFYWNDKIQEEDETFVFFKSDNSKWKKLKKAIEKLHPYDTPCIAKFDITTNKNFGEWVQETLKMK